ncbi:MAG: biotin/lipoate--protein ligase family protein [Hansschlegelia sp.]
MTLLAQSRSQARLILPPAFSQAQSAPGEDAFAAACRMAQDAGPGAFVVGDQDDVIDIAVVLEPDEPLESARRALFAGMLALAEAVGATGPSEMPVTIAWPDTLLYDGARLGGGRLGWPQNCRNEATPDWLVFGAMLIASKAHAGDPGLTPSSTSLEEESFAPGSRELILESFARNLMKAFEIWSEDGFDAVGVRFLAYIPELFAQRSRIDQHGDCMRGADGMRLPLAPALQAVGWRDPATGSVLL